METPLPPAPGPPQWKHVEQRLICWKVRGGSAVESLPELDLGVYGDSCQAEKKGYLGSLLGGEGFCTRTHHPWDLLTDVVS